MSITGYKRIFLNSKVNDILNLSNNQIYVALENDETPIKILNASTNEFIADITGFAENIQIPTELNPPKISAYSLAFNNFNKKVYATDNKSSFIFVINTGTQKCEKIIKLSSLVNGSNDIIFDNTKNNLYVNTNNNFKTKVAYDDFIDAADAFVILKDRPKSQINFPSTPTIINSNQNLYNLNITTNNNQTPLIYKSNNSGIAQVNNIGNIKLISTGLVTIFAGQLQSENYALSFNSKIFRISGPPLSITEFIQPPIITSFSTSGSGISIDAGYYHNLLVGCKNNIIQGWGDNRYNQLNIPYLTGVKKISAAHTHNIALLNDNTLTGWGGINTGSFFPPSGAEICPTGKFFDISANGQWSMGVLLPNQTLTGWGVMTSGQNGWTGVNNLTGIKQISAGYLHSLAVLSNGQLTGWGRTGVNIPSNFLNPISISAGNNFSLAVNSNGRLTGWGNTGDGQINVPTGFTGVIKVSAGGFHVLALSANGKVTGWGDNTSNQITIPSNVRNSFVYDISAGYGHSIALINSGIVIGWGLNGEAVFPFKLLNQSSDFSNICSDNIFSSSSSSSSSSLSSSSSSSICMPFIPPSVVRGSICYNNVINNVPACCNVWDIDCDILYARCINGNAQTQSFWIVNN